MIIVHNPRRARRHRDEWFQPEDSYDILRYYMWILSLGLERTVDTIEEESYQASYIELGPEAIPILEEIARAHDDELTDDDIEYIAKHEAAIVVGWDGWSAREYGIPSFLDVYFYRKKDEADRMWERILKEGL